MSDPAATTANLNLREGPDTTAAIQETLGTGTALEVLERRGDWLRVRVPATGREGFVAAKFVRLPGTPVVAGFLRDDPSLADAPLSPASPRRAGPGGGASAAAAARAWNAYGGLLSAVAERIGIEPEAGVAVLMVESGGTAFVDGRMVIRFENHVFFDRWGKANPDAFAEHFRFDPGTRWKGHAFRATPAGAWTSFHGKQAGEWQVFAFAETLDRKAARMSISMGLPQVMGFNFAALGFPGVDAMFDAFASPQGGERAQVVGMFDFIRGPRTTSPMVDALRARDWTAFAKRYNGTGQAADYGARLDAAYRAARGLAPA